MTETDRIIFTCEHGGNTVPRRYRHLFESAGSILEGHRSHDIGALAVARGVARRFSAPLMQSTVSRLLVDLNRTASNRNVFSEFTRTLDAVDRTRLLQEHYWPYRSRIENLVADTVASRLKVFHLSIHSFTPMMKGLLRTADIGLLYDPSRSGESRFCQRLQHALRSGEPTWRIRRNYPYRGTSDGQTPYLRSLFPDRNYAGIEIEINQNRLTSRADRNRIVRCLGRALSQVMPQL